jgi:hypothetical protein
MFIEPAALPEKSNLNQDTLQLDHCTLSSVHDIMAHTTDTASGAVISDGHGDTQRIAVLAHDRHGRSSSGLRMEKSCHAPDDERVTPTRTEIWQD